MESYHESNLLDSNSYHTSNRTNMVTTTYDTYQANTTAAIIASNEAHKKSNCWSYYRRS